MQGRVWKFMIAAVLPAAMACAEANDSTEAGENSSLAAAHSTQAAHGKHGAHGKFDPAAHAAKLQGKLGLTDEQTTALEVAFSSDSKKEKHAALKEILTEDQLAELKQGHGWKHGKHHAKHGKRHKLDAAGHAATLQGKLGLTIEQAAQVETILAENQSEMKNLHEQMRAAHHGSKDEPVGKEAFAGLRAQSATLAQVRADKMRAVLTADQFSGYEKLVASHHRDGHGCKGGEACEKHGHGQHAHGE